MEFSRVFAQPYREYLLIVLLTVALAQYYVFGGGIGFVLVAALLSSVMPAWGALQSIPKRTITIEAFNFFALAVSFATHEYTSAAFIALMLTIAAWLDWKTESRAKNAVAELLKLKPTKALREKGNTTETVDASSVIPGDILIVKNGERIPTDGVIVYGKAFINEASLTGESVPVEKLIGDEVFSSTVSQSGVIKIRATKVGKDSTLERMAALIAEAAKNKSKAERLADRFAGLFLPIVLLGGIATYLMTKDIRMTAALLLIVCADDIAVSIPLAVTASLGQAARRGVIIKGGEWLQSFASVRTLIFDKTGTLTYGSFALSCVVLSRGVDEKRFWTMIAMAEKFSEHPVGRALFKEAIKKVGEDVEDPLEVKVVRGAGIWAKGKEHEIAIGNRQLAETFGFTLTHAAERQFDEKECLAQTTMMVFLDGAFAGVLGIADTPKGEAKLAVGELRKKGLRLVMLTGDNEEVARSVSQELGIGEYRARMTPESKLLAIEEFGKEGKVAMVGDGINDAPALARADIGIAMGEGGTAIAVEAADVVILTDRVDRIAEMIELSRRTVSVVNADMGIWFVTNTIGALLVFFAGVGPAFAALYNLLTDFLPLANSARLFARRPKDA